MGLFYIYFCPRMVVLFDHFYQPLKILVSKIPDLSPAQSSDMTTQLYIDHNVISFNYNSEVFSKVRKVGHLCVLSFMSFCMHNEPKWIIKFYFLNYFFLALLWQCNIYIFHKVIETFPFWFFKKVKSSALNSFLQGWKDLYNHVSSRMILKRGGHSKQPISNLDYLSYNPLVMIIIMTLILILTDY